MLAKKVIELFPPHIPINLSIANQFNTHIEMTSAHTVICGFQLPVF